MPAPAHSLVAYVSGPQSCGTQLVLDLSPVVREMACFAMAASLLVHLLPCLCQRGVGGLLQLCSKGAGGVPLSLQRRLSAQVLSSTVPTLFQALSTLRSADSNGLTSGFGPGSKDVKLSLAWCGCTLRAATIFGSRLLCIAARKAWVRWSPSRAAGFRDIAGTRTLGISAAAAHIALADGKDGDGCRHGSYRCCGSVKTRVWVSCRAVCPLALQLLPP